MLLPAALTFAVLVALGTWQIQRKAWKEGLIALLTERLAQPPSALPAPSTWPALNQAGNEYRRIQFSGEFDHGKESLVYAAASTFRPDVPGPGYWVFTPARLADGSFVIVNRGFVPEGRQDAGSRAAGQIAGRLEIVGAMRWPESRGWFSPSGDSVHNLWFVRDLKAIAEAKDIGPVAPFYVEQELPVPPGGMPQPGKLVVRLRNEHLQYALTWYGLAVVLVVVFGVWAVNSGREGVGEDAMQPPQRRSRSL
ncbi:MAG TPA: SURF1 family protein [Xanthobacteraceae bacterium]|nr:SURF1 family protein [Xanthobacteraceae bacterium]